MISPASHAPARAAVPARRVRLLLAVLVVSVAAALVSGSPAGAQEVEDTDGPVVDILPVKGFLDPPVAAAITNLLADATDRDAELVVIQVDGPGAISAGSEGVLDAIRGASVPVAVFVSPQQGISARAGGLYGAMWATASVRALSESGTVGPIDPVDLASGAGPDQQTLQRIDAIGATEALAEARTAEELEEAGAVDVLASNVAGLLAELDGSEVTLADGTTTTLELGSADTNVRLHSLGILARLLHAAAAPAFIYLLLVLGLGTLAFEVFQPGFGVAGFAGLVMLPFAVFGLTVLPVTWWALALVVVGLVLYGVDTAMAGLGAVTAAATAAFGAGSWFLFGSGDLRVPPALAILMTLTVLVFFVVVLTVILRAQAGPEGVDLENLVDRHGIVRSVLNPEGHVYVDDALWRARVPDDRKLRVGAPVTVTGVDGPVLIVEPFDPEATSSGRTDHATTP